VADKERRNIVKIGLMNSITVVIFKEGGLWAIEVFIWDRIVLLV
jgi:hypothetical protein